MLLLCETFFCQPGLLCLSFLSLFLQPLLPSQAPLDGVVHLEVIAGAGVGASVNIRAASCCCRTGPCCCHTGPWFSILLSHLGLVLADIVVVAGPPARVQQRGLVQALGQQRRLALIAPLSQTCAAIRIPQT